MGALVGFGLAPRRRGRRLPSALVVAAAVSALLAPSLGAPASGYSADDRTGEACVTASTLHPHGCTVGPLQAPRASSLDLKHIAFAPTGARLDIVLTMNAPIPTSPPGTLFNGGTGLVYRALFTTNPDRVQRCVSLVIGALGNTAAPTWGVAATIGSWDLTLLLKGTSLETPVTGTCARRRTFDDVGATFVISGTTVTFRIPYAAFGGSQGMVIGNLGAITESAYNSVVGARSGGHDVPPQGIAANIDVGPDPCDPSGLHGEACLGTATL